MSDTDGSGASWNDEGDVYSVRFDDDQSPTVVVAEALETVLSDGMRPLFYYVEPDALDALVGDGRGSTVTVTFEVETVLVTVESDSQVTLRL